eukprot:scaffold651362_cov46-Prasinocladus_malaysianus.AAC.2
MGTIQAAGGAGRPAGCVGAGCDVGVGAAAAGGGAGWCRAQQQSAAGPPWAAARPETPEGGCRDGPTAGRRPLHDRHTYACHPTPHVC